jgi:hypothetical protein
MTVGIHWPQENRHDGEGYDYAEDVSNSPCAPVSPGRPAAGNRVAARRVGVSRQTVMRWERARQEGGMEALSRAPHFGRW